MSLVAEDSKGKSVLKSKRFWFVVLSAVVNAALPFAPWLQVFISNNTELVGWAVTLIAGYVGVKTTEPLKLPFVRK